MALFDRPQERLLLKYQSSNIRNEEEPMRVLVIGGTRFIGPPLVRRLAEAGHDVAIFSRGQAKAALPFGIHRLQGDHHRLLDHAAELRAFRSDVVVDMIAYTEDEAFSLVAVFRGMVGRLVTISSGDVYRAYGVFARLEQDSIEPTPMKEDSSLRQVFISWQGQRG
jgi:nucleoside-diphosphate-sugar epimerase